MNLKKEDIYKKLEESFKNTKNRIDSEEIKLSLDYHLNGKCDLKNFIKFYNLDIEDYQKKFTNERQKITKLITYISLTKTQVDEVIEKLPFLKTLDVFNKINTIYFLYTKESKRKFEEITTYFLLNNSKIQIKGKQIDSENITNMLKYLKELVINGDINKENTLIDSTLGLKLTGIAMYKLAVEHGIKTVTWKDFQIPIYTKVENEYIVDDEKNGKRVPLLAELKLIEEPTDENMRIYQAINNEIEKFNFHAVANYYKNMKMKDYTFFYEELGNLINLTTILEINPEKFYKYIHEFLNKIFAHNFSEKIVIEKIKNIVLKLSILIDYPNIENSDFKFTNEEILEEKSNQAKYELNNPKIKENLYYALVLKYLFANSKLSILNKKISKSIFEIIFKNESIDFTLDDDKYFQKLFSRNRDFDEIIEYLDFTESLVEEEYSLVYLKGFTIYLKKFGIKIDLEKEINGFFKKNGNMYTASIPIIKLFEGENNNFTYDLRNLEDKEWKKSKFDQYKTKLKNEVIFNLNNLVRKKLREKDYTEYDLITEIIEGTGSAKKYNSFLGIEINEIFLNYK